MMNIINDRDGIGARKNDQVLVIETRLVTLLRQVLLKSYAIYIHNYLLFTFPHYRNVSPNLKTPPTTPTQT